MQYKFVCNPFLILLSRNHTLTRDGTWQRLILLDNIYCTETSVLEWHSVCINNNDLALYIKRPQLMNKRTKHLITRDGFTFLYTVNVPCVIKGFYRTSKVTKNSILQNIY